MHPGGPFWRDKDAGAWQMPKGEMEPGEDAETRARREAAEELGVAIDAELSPLDEIRQAGGKLSAEAVDPRGERRVLWLYQDVTARRHSEIEPVEAIEAVMMDASWFGRSITDKLATLRAGGVPATPGAGELSKNASAKCSNFYAGGLDDKAIAGRLGLSGNTVRNPVSRLYAKIGVNRRSDAVIWARERGIGGRAGPRP